MKYYLVFDTETTGLPKNWKAPMTDIDNWPRVIQLAWVVCDEDGEIHSKEERLIRADGWVIPEEEFWIKNGFSTAKNLQNGISMPYVLNEFVTDLVNCDYLVSHNISFDYNVLGAEMIRYGVKGKRLEQICTKTYSTKYCAIPGPYGYKWPRLDELHEKLFKKGFDGAHDALSDVIACKDCLIELKRLGIINK